MFASIVRNGYVSIFEVMRIHVGPAADRPDLVEVSLESSRDFNSHMCERESTEVYVMNDGGRTIQHWHKHNWPRHLAPDELRVPVAAA